MVTRVSQSDGQSFNVRRDRVSIFLARLYELDWILDLNGKKLYFKIALKPPMFNIDEFRSQQSQFSQLKVTYIGARIKWSCG